LRWRLVHTNRPERKNINAMKNMSLNDVNRAPVPQRCASTTGNAPHRRGWAVRLAGGGGAKGL
jgi:hypothetical protein